MQYSIYDIIIMKLVDIKGNITSRQRLAFFIALLLVLVVVFTVLRNAINMKSTGIDYKKTDITDFLIYSTQTSDREIYWNLNEIVRGFVGSYQGEYNKEVKSIDDYYNALDSNYKKYLGKKKYKELTNSLISKVVGEDKDALTTLPEPLITNVYKLTQYNNAYICELSTVNSEDKAYVGIIIDINEGKYNIFYID